MSDEEIAQLKAQLPAKYRSSEDSLPFIGRFTTPDQMFFRAWEHKDEHTLFWISLILLVPSVFFGTFASQDDGGILGGILGMVCAMGIMGSLFYMDQQYRNYKDIWRKIRQIEYNMMYEEQNRKDEEQNRKDEEFELKEIQRAIDLREEGGLENLENALKIFTYYRSSNSEMDKTLKEIAYEKEKLLDFKGAIEIFEKLKMYEDSKRVRKKIQDEGRVKVDQTVVHGDYVDDRDTIVKDSVISKSNVGAGGKSKAEEIKEIKELLDSGAISEEDYEKMKREIVG